MTDTRQAQRYPSIWWFAFGYFACYAPYSALTKYLSKYLGISGNELLPITAFASLVGMFLFISSMRWWKYATHKTILGHSVPMPGLWTFLSGLGTAAVIPTTTLAYTFGNVSIVFMMLLMRGGVLIIAPITDFFSGRKVKWYSWIALALSVISLLAAFFVGKVSYDITVPALINLGIYLAAYFMRLRFMTKLAKSDDDHARTRYFVEEQMVATPVLMLTLGAMALLGAGPMGRALAIGFTKPLEMAGPWTLGIIGVALLIGILSQGTGIFGGLILLDKRENTFCVPVNRVSSLLAGIVASYGLWLFLNERRPPANELVGVALLAAAILTLSVGPGIDKRRKPAPAVVTPLPVPAAIAEASPQAKQKLG
ncbi:MAG: hypothetical protein HY901_35490 [Deltaproteobacteria bacterium]|nr:hypothetical protein [Deltaproteobacteria bacterium]